MRSERWAKFSEDELALIKLGLARFRYQKSTGGRYLLEEIEAYEEAERHAAETYGGIHRNDYFDGGGA